MIDDFLFRSFQIISMASRFSPIRTIENPSEEILKDLFGTSNTEISSMSKDDHYTYFSEKFNRSKIHLSADSENCKLLWSTDATNPLHIGYLSHLFIIGKKEKFKAPKIQRLVTPLRLQRKRRQIAMKKKRAERKKQMSSEYAKLLAQYLKEKRERKRSESKRRSSTRESQSQSTSQAK